MDQNKETNLHPDALAVYHKFKHLGFSSKTNTKWAMEHAVVGCESPIEQILAVALAILRPDFMHVANQVEVAWYESIRNQDERIFRPDFLVGLNWIELTPDWEYASRGDWWDSSEAYKWLPFFAVECDGRDYHNDHAAIERDKRRDRIFMSRGMPVLRFTGSEIFNNPKACAEQVVDLFVTTLREMLYPAVNQNKLIYYRQKKFQLGKYWDD